MDDRPVNPPAATPAKPRRRRGCLLLLGFTVGGLLCAGCLFTWWLRSDGDLEALRRELQARHLQVRPAEPPQEVVTPEVRGKWERVQAFGFKSLAILEADPFSPIIDSEREESAREQDAMNDLHAAVDDLGVVPPIPRPLPTGYQSLETFSAMMPRFFLMRDLRLADRALIAVCCHRLLGLCAVLPARTSTDLGERDSMIESALDAIAARLDAIKETAPGVADELARTATLAVGDVHDAQWGELVADWQNWSDLTNMYFAASTESAWLNKVLDHTVVPVAMRAGRASYLRHLADIVELVDPRTPPDVVVRTCLQMKADEPRLYRSQWLIGSQFYAPGQYPRPAQAILGAYMVSMHARLLAAVMRGQPWPEDWTDPLHGPIRPLIRGGRVVGAYALGGGPDLGGRAPNIYWALYERL